MLKERYFMLKYKDYPGKLSSSGIFCYLLNSNLHDIVFLFSEKIKNQNIERIKKRKGDR